MAFDWIVPINTTAADTQFPGFYLGMYSVVCVALTYLFFAHIIGSGAKITNTTKTLTWRSMADLGFSIVFGFIVFVTMYSYAWGGYLNVVLYNYAPDNRTLGTYQITLTQDFYALGASSIGLWYGLFLYIYRWVNYTYYQEEDGKKVEKDENGNKNIPVESTGMYVLKHWFQMLAILAWVMLPGILAYKSNGGYFTSGGWLVLVNLILVSVYTATNFLFAVQSKVEDKIFPTINHLVISNQAPETSVVTGFMFGYRTDLTFLLALMFYITSSEMMIYGDLIKVAGSWFVGFYLVALMAALVKDRASFFPYHIIMKTYFFIFNYWLEYVRTPIPTTQQGSLIIDKDVVDICSFTTGPSYYTMNNYITSFLLFAGMGMALGCVSLLIIWMGVALFNEEQASKYRKVAVRYDNAVTFGGGNSRQEVEGKTVVSQN